MGDKEYRRLTSASDVMKRSDLRATQSRLISKAPELAEARRAALDLAQVAVCLFRILAGLPVSSDRFADPAARR